MLALQGGFLGLVLGLPLGPSVESKLYLGLISNPVPLSLAPGGSGIFLVLTFIGSYFSQQMGAEMNVCPVGVYPLPSSDLCLARLCPSELGPE